MAKFNEVYCRELQAEYLGAIAFQQDVRAAIFNDNNDLEILDLHDRINTNLQNIHERILIESEPIIYYQVKKYQNSGLSFNDLLQEARIAVKRAIEKYNPNIKTKENKTPPFGGYLTRWVKHNITRALDKNRNIPIYLQQEYRKIFQEMRRIGEDPDFPNLDKIADNLKMRSELVKRAYETCYGRRDSRRSPKEMENIAISESFESGVDHQLDVKNALDYLTKNVTTKQRIILEIKVSDESLTTDEIGARLGVSGQAVRASIKRAIKLMEPKVEAMREKGLIECLINQ